ncbi:MAG TPA: hypothetical protein VIZ17_13220 [Acetobacteraceae bacterium]
MQLTCRTAVAKAGHDGVAGLAGRDGAGAGRDGVTVLAGHDGVADGAVTRARAAAMAGLRGWRS